MRKLVSIFVFSATLFIGVFSLPILYTPTIYEKLYPTFSQDEINSLIGKKVINRSNTWWRRGMKYSLEENMNAEVSQNGETGRVADVQKVMEGKDINLQKIMKKCRLLVKWDEKNKYGQDMFSCDSRTFLEFE